MGCASGRDVHFTKVTSSSEVRSDIVKWNFSVTERKINSSINRYIFKHHIQFRKYLLGFDKLFVQNQLHLDVLMIDNQCKEDTREDSDFFWKVI